MTPATAREEVLERIRRGLIREPSAHPQTSRGRASSSALAQRVLEIKKRCEDRRGDLIKQFESEVSRVGGRVYRAHSTEAAVEYIEQIASNRNAGTIVAWNGRLVDSLGLPDRLDKSEIKCFTEATDQGLVRTSIEADIGVTGVDYALADTGTLVLLAREGQARSISLLPPVHIAIVKADQIISSLDDLFPLIRLEAGDADLSSAITFITGPSRTADIELTLVVGVHGPQELHAVILEA